MASTISSLAEVFLIDSRTSSGAFQFPNASSNQGRKLTIKDAYGTFNNSTVQLLLSSTDTFDDGTTMKTISTNNAAMSFFATSNRWYSYSSNTSGGYSSDRTGFNCNAPRFGIDVNGVANFSTLTDIYVNPSTSNLWVAVGKGDKNILYSSNGITWFAAPTQGGGFSYSGNCVAYANGIWVIGGNDATAVNQFKYSYDGKNWSNITTNTFDYVNLGCSDIKWNGRMWVAVGGSTTSNGTIKYSYNGINWSNANQGFSENTGSGYIGGSVCWNGSMWVAGGYWNTTITNGFKYSYDGINWSNSTSVDNVSGLAGFPERPNGIIWDGHRFLACLAVGSGYIVDTLKYSTDGRNWVSGIFNDHDHLLTGALYTGFGYWFGMWDVANNNLTYSPDGYTNFANVNSLGDYNYSFSAPVYNGQMFVYGQRATASNNTIVYSYDGFTWNSTSGEGFTHVVGCQHVGFSSNGPVYNQSNFRIYEQAIWTPLVSTNNFFCMPSSMLINNSLLIDRQTACIQVNTNVPQTQFALDVNGPMRYGILPSTVSAGGTLTITPGTSFGTIYNVTTSGTYTISLASTQPQTNIGKFYEFRNNSGTNMTVTISGGSGIPSPMPFSTNVTTMIVVASPNAYALFAYQ
jgi:hypothetical protein